MFGLFVNRLLDVYREVLLRALENCWYTKEGFVESIPTIDNMAAGGTPYTDFAPLRNDMGQFRVVRRM